MSSNQLFPSAPTTPQGGNVQFGNTVVNQFPKVAQQQPAIASAAIQTNDPNQAMAIGATATVAPVVNALQTHQQMYNSSGWWDTILKDTKDVAGAVVGAITKAPIIGTLAQWAYKPLQEIQKDYKFLHSLYADHGAAAGLLGTLGVVAGGALGSVFGPEGTVIGAGLGGAFDRNILGRVIPNYNSSLVKSNDPNYLVSFGRDLAHGLSDVPGFGTLTDTSHGFGQVVSGIADATFDFSADPLGKFGKMYSEVKKGNYTAEAKNPDGSVMRDESGLPIIKATLPIASRAPMIDNLLKTMAPQVQSSDQLLAAYNNPLNWQFRSAVKNIAQESNPVSIQYRFHQAGLTTPLANALAKAGTEKQVLDVFGQCMYSREFAQAATPTGALTLPVMTLGKMFSNSWGAERIRMSAQASTINDEKNFLLPKKSTIMEPQMEPVIDSNGVQVVAPDGTPQMQQSVNEFGLPTMKAKLDANGEVMQKINSPVWASNPKQLPENFMNALAAKVRTFSGRRALSMNQDLMKQSSEKIDFSDPQAGKTVYDLMAYTMPANVAREYAAKVMTAGSDNERRALLRAAQTEALKAAGLPAEAGALNKILSQVHRATFGDEVSNGVYGFLDGKALGNMEDAQGNAVNAALDPSQRYLGSMMDLKKLHQAMRATKAYGVLYNKGDDFLTHYTNRIFAPLTLLSTGFAFRVGGAEALHQVIREGLGDYLSNMVATTASKFRYQKYSAAEQEKVTTAVAQALTPEDLAVADKPITSGYDTSKPYYYRETSVNGLTDLLGQREHLPAWFAKNKDLALGQHGNTGVMLHFDVENHRLTAGENSVVGSRTIRNFEGRNTRKDVMNFQGDSSERSLLLNGKDALNSIDRVDFNAETWKQVSKPLGILQNIENPLLKALKQSNFQVSEHSDGGASFVRAPQRGDMVSSNAVTKDLAEREKGYKALVQNALKASGSKASYNSAADEVLKLKAKVHPVGWIADKFASSKVKPYSVQQKIEDMTRFHMSVGSDGIPAGIASDHGASADSAALDNIDHLTQVFGHSKKPGEELAGLTQMDPHFKMYWAQNLSKVATSPFHQDIASDYFKIARRNPGLDQSSIWNQVQARHEARLSDINSYPEYRGNMDGLSRATPASFAREQVAQLRGLVQGSDMTTHTQFLKNVADGKTTFSDSMKDVPNAQWPTMVLGRRPAPGMDNALRRAQEVGYRTFVNPPMDFISRTQLFSHFFSKNMRDADTMKEMGLLDEDQAVRLAALRGTTEMLPTIHNPQLRSQFAVMHRNLMPFYFAQEQAMKRVGRLVISNPQAFRDFQIIQQGMNNPGFVHTDSNGKKYIVYPLAGEFGNAALRAFQAMGMSSFSGMPESVTGNTASLLTVLPEAKMPGTGVLANVAINQLANHFPLFTGLANVATGGYPVATLASALLPNSAIRDIWQGMSFDQRESQVYNSLFSSMASAYYSGDLPADYASLPPFKQQQIMDKIENNARSNLYIKGLLAFFLPLAPTVSNDHYTKDLQSFRSEYINMLKPVSQGGLGLTLADALAKFTQEHGNSATSYTIARSTQGLNGANMPLSDATMTWVNKNQSLMDNYGNGAAYLTPQSTEGGNIGKIENQLMALGYRERRTPQAFMNAIYVSKGWSDISADYNDYRAAIAAAKKSNNISALTQISQAWKGFTANYGLQNPIWYDDYTSKSRVVNAYQAVADLIKIQDAGKMPTDKQGALVNGLINDYKALKPALESQKINGKPNAMYYNILDTWNGYLDSIIAKDQSFSNVVNGVFRKAVEKL